MKKFIYLLSVLLLVITPLAVVAQDETVISRLQVYNLTLPAGYGVTSVENALPFLAENPDTILLDVREMAEYEAGHLENSVNVPIRTLSQNLNLLPDQSANILVICKGGARAAMAASALGVLGYQNVKILAGGYDAWAGQELPTSTVAYTIETGTAPEIDAVVFGAVDELLSTLPEGFSLVSAQNLVTELTSETAPVLIDVRSLDEWNKGYLDGAQHIWINEFMASQDQWPADKNTPIVVYCGSGYRGGIAFVMLRLMGYTNVRNLSGGVNAWTAAGFPLVGAAPVAPEFDLAAVLTDYVSGLPENFNAVRVADLAAELAVENEIVLVDVRAADAYAEGLIPGAINIPIEVLSQNLSLLPDLDANIVLYCASGHRSALAMTTLGLLGYTNVRSMMGGFPQWAEAGNPTTVEATVVEPGTVPVIDETMFGLVDKFLTSLPANYYTVKPIDLQVELTSETAPVLIDVRTEGERAQGFIEGSLFLTLSEFMNRAAEWPQDKTTAIVVYDNPTHRSSMALTFMRLMGYENVRALGGGIGGWTSNQLPVATE